jgi:FdrA protein
VTDPDRSPARPEAPAEVRAELRRGAYHDSVVLLGLQRALAARPGVLDAAVVMATPGNRDLVASLGLLPPDLPAARAEDLLVAVRGQTAADAVAALAAVDELLAAGRGRGAGGGAGGADGDGLDSYRPHTLATALAHQPETSWVTLSVPGRYAAALAEEALRADRHVFLFSDNVPLADEVALKRLAAARGRLLLGPDCGTANVGGVAVGFANRVPRGPVGIVAASGTGAQLVASGLAAAGVGITHLLGTGGRDLSEEVGGATALAALHTLAADPATTLLVLVGKPPAPAVAQRLLAAARASGKPTVVALLGFASPVGRLDNLWFARGLDDAVEIAAELAHEEQAGPGRARSAPSGPADAHPGQAPPGPRPEPHPQPPHTVATAGRATPPARWLRGLFAGGTLAEETLLALRPVLAPLRANLALPGIVPLGDPHHPVGHAVLDLGDDLFTVGRLHPMLDPTLRLQRLAAEAADPAVAVVLLDVVLGHGADPDPAASLAPAIAAALGRAAGEGRPLEVGVLLVGTAEDPQGLADQRTRLAAAGATVVTTVTDLARHALAALDRERSAEGPAQALPAPLAPVVAVNVGLASFAADLAAQGVRVVDLDWRPPGGGEARISSLLARLGGARPAASDPPR